MVFDVKKICVQVHPKTNGLDAISGHLTFIYEAENKNDPNQIFQ